MAEVIWSPRSLKNLDEITEFLERRSEELARTFARELDALVRSIPGQPLLGAVVPEWERYGLRESSLRSYRVIYRLRGDDVEVVTVTHGARRLPRTPPN